MSPGGVVVAVYLVVVGSLPLVFDDVIMLRQMGHYDCHAGVVRC